MASSFETFWAPKGAETSQNQGTTKANTNLQDTRKIENAFNLAAKMAVEYNTIGPSLSSQDQTKPKRIRFQRVPTQQSNANVAENETDFTIQRMPGKLGCPFSNIGLPKPADHVPTNLPTPRSSTSDPRDTTDAKRSKRSSFNDPLRRPSLHPSPPASASIAADKCLANPSEASGPVCPIRFLDQHSPEEIAEYFEQHKHELPRSHELCVQRFQRNTNSVRELDARYGSLVTMIQGLGMKHQSYLREEPVPERPNMSPSKEVAGPITGEQEQPERLNEPAQAGNSQDDSKPTTSRVDQRVQSWMQKMSESGARDHTQTDASATNNGAVESKDGEMTRVGAREKSTAVDAQTSPDPDERVSHFDRPLKDIRVGESPSRPWGVPIPSKYLDRNESYQTDTSVLRLAGEAAEATKASKPAEQDAQVHGANPAQNGKAVQGSRAPPAARCPFGHGASSNPPAYEDFAATPAVAANSNLQNAAGAAAGVSTSNLNNAHVEGHEDTGADTNDLHIVNHGLAVVAPGALKQPGVRFSNHGTLFFGYIEDTAPGLFGTKYREDAAAVDGRVSGPPRGPNRGS